MDHQEKQEGGALNECQMECGSVQDLISCSDYRGLKSVRAVLGAMPDPFSPSEGNTVPRVAVPSRGQDFLPSVKNWSAKFRSSS